MTTFKQFLIEDQILRSQLENQEYEVVVGGLWSDQPTLDIKGTGYIKLYWNGEYYAVHGIRGESRGAGTILYFAALEFITNHGLKPRTGMLASDTTLSPDAVRTRKTRPLWTIYNCTPTPRNTICQNTQRDKRKIHRNSRRSKYVETQNS